jgi:ABC-type Fe3+/spermidine/putrescine transport system ATPase subunit
VTHDQAEAMALSDRIAVLDRGRLLQYDAPRVIYARPASRTVADFMGLINLLPARVAAAEAGEGTIVAGPVRLRLPLRTGIRVGAGVALGIRPESVRLSADQAGAISATVEEQLYLGNFSEYRVALDDGTKLRVQAPAQVDFPVGSRIGVTIDSESCSLFPSDDRE